MTPYTPGPWRYEAEDKLNPDRAFGIVRSLGRKFDREAGTKGATEVIAEVCVDDGSGTAEADARLIAAAPELAEALALFLRYAMDTLGMARDLEHIEARAKAALQKAGL